MNPNLQLHGVFVRRINLDTNALPQEIGNVAQRKFEFKMNLRNDWRPLGGINEYAATMTLTLSATVDGREVEVGEFVLEVAATLENFDEVGKQQVLNYFLPNQALPYLRELVSNMTGRTGFPQVVLPALLFQPTAPDTQQPALEGTPPAIEGAKTTLLH